MPKKTREEKMLAQKRRMLQTTEAAQQSAAPSLSVQDFLAARTAPTPEGAKPATATNTAANRWTTSLAADAAAVKQEVFRIAIFTVVLLCTEFVLFYLIEIRKVLF